MCYDRVNEELKAALQTVVNSGVKVNYSRGEVFVAHTATGALRSIDELVDQLYPIRPKTLKLSEIRLYYKDYEDRLYTLVQVDEKKILLINTCHNRWDEKGVSTLVIGNRSRVNLDELEEALPNFTIVDTWS